MSPRLQWPVFLAVGLTLLDHGLPALASSDSPSTTVTFTEHVAPILFKNCATCHRPGEAAPFSLLTYQDAKKRGKQIAEETARHFMPPWHADSGHLPFADERRLTDAQIATLAKWHRDGMTEGDASKLPPLPKFPEGWQLGKPDLVLTMPEAFEVPAEGRDIYRNFVLPMHLPSNVWVRAIEFRPGARSVVHHSLFYLDTTGTAREYDAKDPQPGYPGMNRSNRQFGSAGGWAVGGDPQMLPEGLAWQFETNADLVLQTHFHPTGKAEKEISTVGIYFSKQPPTRQFTTIQVPPLFGRLHALDIPAGETNYVIKDSFTLPVDVEVFGVTGHAHMTARRLQMIATLPDGRQKTLIKISNWDFKWQENYRFKDNLRLPKGTRLNVEIAYDNSDANPNNPNQPARRIKWGPMSTDEMGALTLSMMPARDEDLAALRQAHRAHIADLFIDRAQESTSPKERERVEMMGKIFDKNGNGKIDADERPALRAYLEESGALKSLGNSF